MKDDLRRLLISENEMYSVSGFDGIRDTLQRYRGGLSSTVDRFLYFAALSGALGLTVVGAMGLALAASWSHGIFAILPSATLLGCAAVLFYACSTNFEKRHILRKCGTAAIVRYEQYRSPLPMQKRLYEDVDRYNKLVRAIHVSDEIDAVGVKGARIEDREPLLKSMALARQDLMRALRIERIMRENADVSNIEFQLFNIDLTHIAAMQVEDAASQQGKLMNEAFQIARDVQLEVHKMQTADLTADAETRKQRETQKQQPLRTL